MQDDESLVDRAARPCATRLNDPGIKSPTTTRAMCEIGQICASCDGRRCGNDGGLLANQFPFTAGGPEGGHCPRANLKKTQFLKTEGDPNGAHHVT